MYVTRPLSTYLANPEAAAEPPPDGPGSGILVVLDEGAQQQQASTLCWGVRPDRRVRSLPFPQNRQLRVSQGKSTGGTILECVGACTALVSGILSVAYNVPYCGRPPQTRKVATKNAMFVPVIDQPLSSGRYYVVKVDGKHAGKVRTCSREEDAAKWCFLSFPTHERPRAFVHGDVHQQTQVQQHSKGFKAAAVAAYSIPPHYLMKKGWTVVARAKPKYHNNLADDARGVDTALRDQMPDLDSLNIVVVGTWYVPFLFVKNDGKRRLKDQVRNCMFYKMTMEQSWEQICSRDNTHLHGTGGSNTTAAEIEVTATVHRFTAVLGGTTAVAQLDDGGVWFRPAATTTTGGDIDVCLDMVLWDRIKWELERGGRRWVTAAGNGNVETIQRTERRDDGLGDWSKFCCYMLVERFVLRRMNMNRDVALTCEFRHTDKIRGKWS